jgi:hypothetical protein
MILNMIYSFNKTLLLIYKKKNIPMLSINSRHVFVDGPGV